MHRIGSIILLLAICLSNAIGAGKCGFSQLMEHSKDKKLGAARMLEKRGTCNASDLYDSVYVDTTAHFRIFYTTTGPHAVAGPSSYTHYSTPTYINTLAHWLETAYTLHTKTIGMQAPRGPKQTIHYQDSRFPEKYPVEVIDLSLLRNTWTTLGGPCSGCYGLTLPVDEDHSQSVLLIENDFLYQDATDPLTTWTKKDGGTCTFTESAKPITTTINGKRVDYSEQWYTALKVTAFHELYHACQLRYADYNDQYHFWWEASATGTEEIGAPEINDYLQYLYPIFNSPRISLFDYTKDDQMRPYGQGIFYQYLVHRFGIQFDPEIWSALQKSPFTSISTHFDTFAKNHGESGLPTLFHDYARHLVYAGDRADEIPVDSLWADDLPDWPTLSSYIFSSAKFPTDSFGFQLFDGSTNALNYTPGQQSQLIKSVLTINGTDYVIVSSGNQPNTSGESTSSIPALAFPNPWRAKSDLCFQLGGNSRDIEIRDANGNEITQIPRDTSLTKTCINGKVHGNWLAPGRYYWRGSKETKVHPLLVIR